MRFAAPSLAVSAALSLAMASLPAAAADGEPVVQRHVAEDDAVRVDELRVRGQPQRITVSPKRGPIRRGYDIVPPDAGRDPSSSARGLAGQRVWNVLSF